MYVAPASNYKATQKGLASVSVRPFSSLRLPRVSLFGFDAPFCC